MASFVIILTYMIGRKTYNSCPNLVKLERLFGSTARARSLLWLAGREESYAREMAPALDCALNAVQDQLARLEGCGVLSCRRVGRVNMYRLDPAMPLYCELTGLLSRAARLLPPDERTRFAPPARTAEKTVIVRAYED